MASMSPHNALSWGYFDLDENKWQSELLNEGIRFPARLLPNVENVGYTISNRTNTFSSDCCTYVSLGDLQCSVYSCLEKDTDCSRSF